MKIVHVIVLILFTHVLFSFNSNKNQSTLKKVENLTTAQLNYLKEWDMYIPKDKKCINKYVKVNGVWVLEKSNVLYNEKDEVDGFIDVSSISYAIIFYKNYLFFFESSGKALTEEIIIDLKNNIKQSLYYSTAASGTISDFEYENISGKKINIKTIDKNVFSNFKIMRNKYETMFKDFE